MVLLNIEYIIGAVNKNIACPAGRDQGWETARNGVMTGSIGRIVVIEGLCLLFIHPPVHGSEVSPAARNTLDSARIPRASKLLICGLFLKGRVLAQDGVGNCRREMLEHVVVLSERHLVRLMRLYISYYHEDRCHLGLDKDTPNSRPVTPRPSPTAKVVALPRVGGFHHRYEWRDAA